VEGGGDLAASNPPPGTNGWTVEVRGYQGKPLMIKNQAVSTSGDAEQFVEIDGVRYSHIVDPRTGLGLTNRLQATLIAKRGLTTDPLATALCVLGPEKGNALAKRERVKVVWVLPK
jgi:thiamine biosynthesis lipoprotein